MAPVTPCLWFDGTADEAADFYVEIFPNARRTGASAYSEAAPGETGSTMVVTFELDGTPFMALNGGPTYRLTPAVSFVVNCKDQAEVDYYWDRLGAGGHDVQCGWLVDKFGVSWQVVPDRLAELMSDPDPARADRTMQAMLKMVKLDVAALEAAADGR
jgi:predicted 3-demethylubiquinone-9 3-methyltransferase (glyoxalase superfamily)